MQFLIIAYDLPDALPRRLDVRQQHIDVSEELIAQGKLIYGVAILNDRQQLAGSVMLFDVASREELDRLLKDEPYVKANVWDKPQILSARVGPSFVNFKRVR